MTWAQEIIEIFENFLEKKGVKIENPEKEGDGDNTAIIYGTDYGNLEQEINDFLFGERKTSTDNQVKEKSVVINDAYLVFIVIQGRKLQSLWCSLLGKGSAHYYVDNIPDDALFIMQDALIMVTKQMRVEPQVVRVVSPEMVKQGIWKYQEKCPDDMKNLLLQAAVEASADSISFRDGNGSLYTVPSMSSVRIFKPFDRTVTINMIEHIDSNHFNLQGTLWHKTAFQEILDKNRWHCVPEEELWYACGGVWAIGDDYELRIGTSREGYEFWLDDKKDGKNIYGKREWFDLFIGEARNKFLATFNLQGYEIHPLNK